MLQQDHYKKSVYKTPFHERTSELNILNEWTRWKDYTVSTNYFRTDLEYFAVRNTTGVIDYTPMVKQKITGPDSDEFVNLAKDPEHQDVITRLSKWLPSKAAPEFKEKSERLRMRKK